jgi:hypothetical protein
MLAACALAADAGATIVAPGYVVGEIATPSLPTGGVAVVGGAVFVGAGPFGGATQSVVRIDGGGATTVADGFNGLSGFAYDAVNDRLIVGDNSLETPGSETGDTIYGIASPLTQGGTPLRAADIELLPAGSIPGPADITLDPTDATGRSLFVSDSFFPFPGPPNGKVWFVDDVLHGASVVQSGLGFSAGLAAAAGALFVGEVDANDFSGRISSAALPGATGPLTPVATGLVGQSDLFLASDGSILATASAFAGDSFVLRIDPVSFAVSVVASGFDFATGVAEENGTIYVIEGGFGATSRVVTLTLVPEPASATATALGLAALAGAARRRSAR